MANRNAQIRDILEDCKYYDSFIRPEYIRNWRYLIATNNANDLCRRVAIGDILHVPQRKNDDIKNMWTRRGRRNIRYNDPQDYSHVESFDPLNTLNTLNTKYTLDITLLIILLVIIYINA